MRKLDIFEILRNVGLFGALLPGVFLIIFCSPPKYIVGSHKRYITASLLITGEAMFIVGAGMSLPYSTREVDVLMVALATITASVELVRIVSVYRKENNWYKDQWNDFKKMCRKVYDTVKGIQITIPVLAPVRVNTRP